MYINRQSFYPLKRGRLIFLIIRELAQKYTRALVFGFICGLFLSLFIVRMAPHASRFWFDPIVRIGVVGEFTPETLPTNIQQLVSSGLTSLTKDGSAASGLATNWDVSEDGKKFTFHLSSKNFWHSGQAFSAKDVNYNIRGVTFVAKDNLTLEAQLQAPYSAFPVVAAKPLFLPGLVGVGNYKVTSIELKGNSVKRMTLVPAQKSDRMIRQYFFYPTESEAILAYKLGQISRLEGIRVPGDLVSWKKSTIEETTNYNQMVAVFFNTSLTRLSDRNMRQGLAYGIPTKNQKEPADSPIPKTSWAYSSKIKRYGYNPALAKKLLGATQDSTGSAALELSTFVTFLEDAKAIATSWTSLGIPTEVKVVSSVPSDYQVLLSAQNVPPDADQYPLWHSTQNQTNITHYTNVKIDKLLEDGRQTLDQKTRQTLYSDFQRYLTEDVPAAFWYYASSYTIERK